MLTSPTWQMLRSESAHAIRGTGQTLQWLATDTANGAGAWFVERRPDGATWRPPTRQADVTVTGPAGSLLLTLTRRLPLTDRETTNISVAGDADLAQPLARQHCPRQRRTGVVASSATVEPAAELVRPEGHQQPRVHRRAYGLDRGMDRSASFDPGSDLIVEPCREHGVTEDDIEAILVRNPHAGRTVGVARSGGDVGRQ
jgi:hypothetical protein